MADVVISESKLEDMLFNHLIGKNTSESIETAFNSKNCLHVERQLNLSPYGIADIVIFHKPDFDGSVSVEVVELKKGIINSDTFMQASKYRVALKEYGYRNNIEFSEIFITLVGSHIDINDKFEILPNAFEFLNFYTYDIDINTGLSLKRECYSYDDDYMQKDNINKIFTCIDYAMCDQECSFYFYGLKMSGEK